MFQLRKKRPPFGTQESPILEYAYSEQVKVVNGLCDVQLGATRDYLLKMGYEDVELEEALISPGDISSTDNGAQDSDESPRYGSRRDESLRDESPPPRPQPKLAKKKKRWR